MREQIIEIIKKRRGAIDIIDPEKTADEILALFDVMVICVDNLNMQDEEVPLTVGKKYKVERSDNYDYWVTNDNGLEEHYDKEYFLPL